MTRYIKDKLQKYRSADFDKRKHIKDFYLNADGDAEVRIHLSSYETALSSFCTHGHEELSAELCQYIDDIVYHIPLTYNVALAFSGCPLTKEQQQCIRRAIANRYGLVLIDKKQDLKINTYAIIGLLIVGVALLTCSYLLAVNDRGQLLTDIINIAGTFALWEMVDFILLDRRVKKIERLNAGQIVTASISFSDVR